MYRASAKDCFACRFQKHCTQGKMRYLYININYERQKKKAREQLGSSEGRTLSKHRPHGEAVEKQTLHSQGLGWLYIKF